MIDVFYRVLDFTLPILFMIFIGLFGTGILVEMGLMQRFSRITRPIFRHTNLPESCASAFMVSLGSTVAASSMVSKLRDDGCLNKKEVMLCSVMNSTPAYFREIITYQIPIVLPALGPVVGGFYVAVFIITGFVKMGVVIILSRILLDKSSCKTPEITSSEKPNIKTAVEKSFKRTKRLFLKIGSIYLTMTTLVFILKDRGAFEVFNVLPLAELFSIPPESIIPLTSYIASPILGISLLGPMIQNNGISNIQAMIVLMIGSMFMLPVFALRSLVPRYVSFFGPRLGITIVAFSTGISIVIRFVILLILLGIAG